MTASPAAIRFTDVSVSLAGETIHAGLSLEVAEGEFLCILGPSGCGKSTALRMIADLLAPGSGEVEVLGHAPSQTWNQVAFVFQSPRLAPWRDALRNVTLAMELRFEGMPKHEMEERARSLLAMVGLDEDMHKYPRQLSGGERQRVAIARALCVEPRIILMDEPFSALDPNTRRRMREEIVTIWQATGKSIVFVTHDVDEALTLADRVVLLSRKPTRVVETLTLAAQRPRSVQDDPGLARIRDRLHRLFDELEHDTPRS